MSKKQPDKYDLGVAVYHGKKTKCFYCGDETMEKLTRDHFYPKHRGGRLSVWACISCNALKGGRNPVSFVKKLKSLKNEANTKELSAKCERMICQTLNLWKLTKYSLPKLKKELKEKKMAEKSKTV